MATPTLNVIDSYSVINGVEIDFNANSGTNLVRGSVLTILDMSGNVIAWHIYIPSTYAEAATKHVLPSKTAIINESSTPSAYSASTPYIVDDVVSYNGSTYICINASTGNNPTDSAYWTLLGNAVGAFSYVVNDFTTNYIDEQQYQYYISTFVNYDNSLTLVGQSDDSNKRATWTLPQPSISIDTIGTNNVINTTSYTFGITYDTNITTSIIDYVFNPPQVCVFNLYQQIDNFGGRKLVKTSGDVYNGGTVLNNNEYYMNYDFAGMANGNIYLFEVIITSYLGMTSSYISQPFTVEANTYELGAFSVSNDGCNGRIQIKSEIVTIEGESTVEPVDGEIDLTDNANVTWRNGVSFTNNWTLRIWGYDFKIAENIPSSDRILHLFSSTTNGIIDAYILEDNSDDTKIKVGLFVYPQGYSNSVVSYFESNSITLSSISQSTPLFILIGYDYDNTGSYYVKISV